MEQRCKKMKDMFGETYINPFSVSQPSPHLVNFATVAVAPLPVQESLSGALEEKGSRMASQFVSEQLMPVEDGSKPKKSFYDPLSQSNVKTTSEMKKTVRVHTKDISLNAEVMYLRLLAVNAVKQVPLQRVMSFGKAPVPLL